MSFSDTAPEVIGKTIKHQTTFFTANILSCLNSIEELVFENALAMPEVAIMGKFAAIRKSATEFLLSEKSGYGSFNYWGHAAEERKTMPYPDDLDDTFVALAALYGYDTKLIDGSALANAAKLLTAVETVPGGPYRTWLVAQDPQGGQDPRVPHVSAAWRDVDVVVNSNVGHFLSLLNISLPNLATFIDEHIRAGDIGSPYYPGVVQAGYFISRFYDGVLKKELAEIILRERDKNGLWKNQLESAMAISALINLGFAEKITEADVASLTARIEKEGYRPYAFCIDPARDGKTYYAGSAALTAAFCIEALAKYATQHSAPDIEREIHKEIKNSPGATHLEAIKRLARQRAVSLPENLRAVVLGEIEKITAEEIVGVPFLAHAALGQPQNISADVLDELALANLYGWTAYTIYDDFLDGENGEPLLLSAANFFLRELTASYAALAARDERLSGMGEAYAKIMNTIDDANVWEQLHCRAKIENNILELPRAPLEFDDLADRSLGHALPALAVFSFAGYPPDSREAATLLSFFKNYLIARQLHDDAHDWKEDLLRGQINSAGARLLGMWNLNSELASRSVNLVRDLPELQKFFWHNVIPQLVADIKNFLNKARREIAKLENAGVLKDIKPFEVLIERLEFAADRTIRERNEAVEFLEAYKI